MYRPCRLREKGCAEGGQNIASAAGQQRLQLYFEQYVASTIVSALELWVQRDFAENENELSAFVLRMLAG